MEDSCDLLIVDDQQGVRLLLKEVLKEEGYRVEVTSGGAKALELLPALQPGAVILDVKMPGLGGLETLQEMRKENPDVPVIMMTAYGELDRAEELKRYGVRHYLLKPFDLDEVRSLVKAVLNDRAEGVGNL